MAMERIGITTVETGLILTSREDLFEDSGSVRRKLTRSPRGNGPVTNRALCPVNGKGPERSRTDVCFLRPFYTNAPVLDSVVRGPVQDIPERAPKANQPGSSADDVNDWERASNFERKPR